MKLIEAAPQPESSTQVEFTFMLGWSNHTRLEQLKLNLTSDTDTLKFTINCHMFFTTEIEGDIGNTQRLA